MKKIQAINLCKKMEDVQDYWSHEVVAEMNGHHFKLARIKGEFVWHYHGTTDEVFFVLKGTMTIHFRDHKVELSEGDLLVVPKGIEHKPVAEEECHILLVEKEGTVNTGNVIHELTHHGDKR